MSKNKYSFKAYCKKYGKTIADIEKLSLGLQAAWHEEHQKWRESERQLDCLNSPDLRIQQEIEREEAYALLADIGVPFDPMGEPIGIGEGY